MLQCVRVQDAPPKTPAWVHLASWSWLFVVAAIALTWGDGPRLDGDPQRPLPPEHRNDPGDALLLLAIAEGSEASTEDLLLAATQLRERFADAWAPLGPPANEMAGWLDAHALLLMPPQTHGELRERLGDAAIDDAVAMVRARMSSPFFLVHGADARRDPLGLRTLTRQAAAGFGREQSATPTGAQTTGSGDLLSADGRALLLLLRRPADEVPLSELARTLEPAGLTVAEVGHASTKDRASARLDQHWRRLPWLLLCGLLALLSVLHRRALPPIALVGSLGALVLATARLHGTLEFATLPVLAALAVVPLLALRHGGRFDPLAWLLLGSAWAGLWFCPVLPWPTWSFAWPLACLAAATVVGLVGAGLRRTGASRGETSRAQPTAIAWRSATVVAIGSVLGLAAWQDARFAPLHTSELDAPPPALLRNFFDPRAIVWTHVEASTPEAALEAAAVSARAWLELPPGAVVRVDSPGNIVLPAAEIAARRHALVELDLTSRLQVLEAALQTRGFRPAAFGEFLRSAANPHVVPSAEAALQSPLGRWIERYLERNGEETTVRTELWLPEDATTPLPDPANGELRGPAIADRSLRPGLPRAFVTAWLVQLWIGALMIWLPRRDLRTALVAAAMGVTSVGFIAALVTRVFELAWTTSAFPMLLLASALAMVSTVRARAGGSRTDDAILALAPCIAGLALASLRDPEFYAPALVLGLCGVLSLATGRYVAPGLLPKPTPENP